MKKIYFLVLSVLLLTRYSAQSQCTFGSAFGSATINLSGTVVTISTCSFAGEYSTINGAVNGQTLRFTSSVATDFITIHSGTPAGPVIAFGVTPLVFANTFTGTVYAHWATSAACGTQSTCRTTTVQCTSCAAPPGPCTNGSAFATATISPTGAIVTISTCSFAGEYSTINGAVNGQTLRFTSSVASDNITVHSGTPAGPVLAFGTTPLVFANTFTGTVYAHWNTPGCGSQSTCRTTTVQCTSCVLPPPPNDLCTGAITINCGQSISSSTATGATTDPVGTCGTSLNTAPGVWYTFVGDGSTVTLNTCTGTSYDSKIGVFSGSCAGLVCVAGNDDFCGLQSQVTFPTVVGTNYYIIVTGFGAATGAFTLTRTCSCIGVPSPGVITGPSGTLCNPTAVTLTVSGYSGGTGITFQWKSSATSGGPYGNIAGATGTTYAFSATATRYYIVTVTCTASGFSSSTSEFAVNVTNLAHTNVIATPASVCAPGSTLITGTATGGTVGSNVVLASSGVINLAILDVATVTTNMTVPANSLATFNDLKLRLNVRHSWVGDLRMTLTSPCGTTLLFDRPGVPQSGLGNSANLGTSNATTPPPGIYIFDVAGATIIPEVAPAAGFITPGTYQPSNAANPGVAHNWVGLTFPCATAGTWTLSIQDLAGGDVGLLVDWAILFNANYTHALTGPGTITQNPPSGTFNANASFNVTGLPAGNQVMTLTTTDGAGCTVSTPVTVTVNPLPVITIAPPAPVICNGAIVTLVTTVVPAGPVVWSPLTELYTDAGATIAYTGTAVSTVYAKPTVTRTYTANATSAAGCLAVPATVTITVNQLPFISGQPTPATQTVCPGSNVTYTVTATGTGLTYQWRRNGVNLVNGGLINLSSISGATTNALTISNVGAANAGNYDVVISGTCPPPVTSNTVVLNVASAPTITTQPANVTVCANQNAVFSVVATGVPPPNIYQWQVSTDGGATWTNLSTGGSFTATFTITAATTTLSGNRYRVIVTNSCGQSVTSNAVTLTVNAIPVVVAADLFNRRVCISDTLVPLQGSPVGGSWSGIGVSGFNFVPPATAVGTYVLTYTYTNSLGCTISDTTTVKVQDCPERLRELTDDALIIYPNPNNGHFNVRMNSVLYNYLGMKVYNMNGQLMIGNAVTNPATNRETLVTPTYTGLVYGRVTPIDLSMLANGTYLVVFYYDDGIRTSKKGFLIMIQK